jgi:membrane-bound metal-dependent hydrolase YbcI (DUF457 family)
VFIGHYALALAAKRAVPKVSLGVLFGAAQLPDLVWPVCVLLGWERVAIVPGITAFNALDFTSYPWSHSLLMVAAWGAAAGWIYFLGQRDRTGAVLIGLLAVSHWVLDWATHRPDMPLWPGGTTRVGLGLWNSVGATVLIEGALYLVGAIIYLRATQPRDRTGRYALGSLLLVLAAFYLADRFGTVPPSERALGWFALVGGWLPVFWAAWADRHRVRRESESG